MHRAAALGDGGAVVQRYENGRADGAEAGFRRRTVAQPPFFCARAALTPAANCFSVTFTANPFSDRKKAARGMVMSPSPVVSTAPCGATALTLPSTAAPSALRTSAPEIGRASCRERVWQYV